MKLRLDVGPVFERGEIDETRAVRVEPYVPEIDIAPRWRGWRERVEGHGMGSGCLTDGEHHMDTIMQVSSERVVREFPAIATPPFNAV